MATVDLNAFEWERNTLLQGSPKYNTRNGVFSRSTLGNKVAGGFITLPNGNRFRRSTSYARSNLWVEYGSPNYATCLRTSNGYVGEYSSGNGGYFAGQDIIAGMYLTVGAPWIPSAVVPPSNPVNSSYPLLFNEANTKALLKISDSKAGLGEDLATLGQTIRMIKHPLSGLVKGLQAMKNDKTFKRYLMKSARDLLREGIPEHIAQRYLEYVYGWKPLMQDIHGLIDLAKEQGGSPLLLHAVGRSKRNNTSGPVTYNDSTGFRVIKTSGMEVEYKGSTSIWARVDPDAKGLRMLNSLGLANPLSLAWELLPWSFVVDWALPIGSTLAALTAPAGLIFVNGSQSVRVSGTCPYQITKTMYSGYQKTSETPGDGTIRYEGYRRQEITTWPTPGFWYDSDPLRLNSDGSDRVFKALALALTNLRFR